MRFKRRRGAVTAELDAGEAELLSALAGDLLVLLGAAVGAPLRYLVDLLVSSRHDRDFPWGTLTVNALGSVVLGATAGALAAEPGPGWVLPLEESRQTAAVLDAAFASAATGGAPVLLG